MYEDSWYFVPETATRKDESQSQTSKHRRRESLLKQTNVSPSHNFERPIADEYIQGTSHVAELPDPILELSEEKSILKGPPEATLARRAKSYSDFYDIAVSYLGKESKVEKPRDVFETLERNTEASSVEIHYEDCEEDILDASQEEYQYVKSD